MINIKRLLKSFIYALRGLFKVLREEQNLKIQITVAILVVIAALFLRISGPEWGLLVFAIGLVILAEIINSAVERITDVLKPRINGYAKEIKDVMAAAVMIASLTAFLIGLIIFLPYLFS